MKKFSLKRILSAMLSLMMIFQSMPVSLAESAESGSLESATYYLVTFYDGDGSTILKQLGAQSGATVDLKSVKPSDAAANERFTGWSTDGKNVLSSLTVTKTVNLYPVFEKSWWLRFNSNGEGASYTASVQYDESDVTAEPAAPEREGYTFTGWYRDAEAKNRFVFGRHLTEDTTVYAGWQAADTVYTLILWGGNADDEEYSYLGREERNAKSGSEIRAEQIDLPEYENYVFDHADEAITVSGDGSSTLNVYYQRNTYTLTFEGEDKTYGTIEAKWGANIREEFDAIAESAAADGYNLWLDVNASSEGNPHYIGVLLYMGTADNTYRASREQDSGSITYVTENLSGEGYSVAATYGADRDNVISEEDFIAITGFTYTGNVAVGTRIGDGVELRYSRNSYTVSFANTRGAQIPDVVLAYEAETSAAEPEGYVVGETIVTDVSGARYVFAGWYDNEALAGEKFSFEGKMPAANVILYAAWEPERYTVNIDPNGGVLGEGESESFRVDYLEKVQEYKYVTREGYTLLGWYQLNGDGTYSAYDFEAGVVADLTLVALWRNNESFLLVYAMEEEVSGGTFADGAELVLIDEVNEKLTPEGKKLVGWSLPDGTEAALGAAIVMDGTLAVKGRYIVKPVYEDLPVVTEDPTVEPTAEPTEVRTEEPTAEPTVKVTETPTEEPTTVPVKKKLLTRDASILKQLMSVSANSSDDTSVTGGVSGYKTLDDNGDGTYNLQLAMAAMTGSDEEVKKANVIFVYDSSNSMVTNYVSGGYTRRAKQDEAMINMVKTLFAVNEAAGVDDMVEVSIVQFDTEAYWVTDSGTSPSASSSTWYSGSDISSFEKALTSMTVGYLINYTEYNGNDPQHTGATNWDDGLHKARRLALAKKTAEPDEDIYIVFLSDGKPSVHFVESDGITTPTNDNNGELTFASSYDRRKDGYLGIEADDLHLVRSDGFYYVSEDHYDYKKGETVSEGFQKNFDTDKFNYNRGYEYRHLYNAPLLDGTGYYGTNDNENGTTYYNYDTRKYVSLSGQNYADHLNSAVKEAEAIKESGYNFFVLNVFGTETGMPENMETMSQAGGGGAHYEASDPEILQEALDGIAATITSAVSIAQYKNLKFEDELTKLTSVKTDASGSVSATFYRYRILEKDDTGYYYTVDGEKKYVEVNEGKPILERVENGKTIYYQKNTGETYSDGQVTLEDKNLQLDLSGVSVEDGWLYTADVTIWPSQASYDAVAGLNNGTIKLPNDLSSIADLLLTLKNGTVQESDIPADLKDYIYKDADGEWFSELTGDSVNGYGLNTNKPGPKVSYEKEEKKSSSYPDYVGVSGSGDNWTYDGKTLTKDGENTYSYTDEDGTKYTLTIENGIYTVTITSDNGTEITNPDPVPLNKEKISARKTWSGVGDDDLPEKIEFTVYADGKEYATLTLTKEEGWKSSIFLAPGLISSNTKEILEAGHDYTLSEGTITKADGTTATGDYHWEFESGSFHPMLYGTELVAETTSTSGSKTATDSAGATKYYVTYNEASMFLEGANVVTSTLDIDKDITGTITESLTDLDNEKFTFEVVLTQKTGSNYDGVNYYINTIVDASKVKTTGESQYTYTDADGNTVKAYYDTARGEYYISAKGKTKVNFANGTGIVTEAITRNQFIRFTNLPQGTTYTVTETLANGKTLSTEGYTVNSIIEKEMKRGRKTSGTADPANAKLTGGRINNGNTAYDVIFTNTNTALELDLKVQKELTGRAWLSTDSFDFTVSGEPAPQKDGKKNTTATVTDASEEHTETFGTVKFTKTGTYTYIITEDTSKLPGGVSTGKAADTITVVVGWENGQLVLKSVTANEKNTATKTYWAKGKITNNYTAEGTLDLEGKKTLNGRTLKAGEFSFILADSTGKALQTKTNAADGKVTFDTITYTLDNMSKDTYGNAVDTTITYYVYEVKGTATDIEWDTHLDKATAYPVNVKLHDNQDGTITATVTDTVKDYQFTNKAVGKILVSKKIVSDAESDHAKTFTYTITLSDKTDSASHKATLVTKDAGGKVTKTEDKTVKFTAGVATITLTDLQTMTIEGILQNATWDVTETQADDFTVTNTGAAGTTDSGRTSKGNAVTADGTEVVYTNTRDKGDLKITKTVLSDAGSDKTEISFTFTVSLKDENGKALTGEYEYSGTSDGTTAVSGKIKDGGTITLKHGGSVTVTGLPIGAKYTVTETQVADFTETKTGDTGTIAKSLSTAAFTNTRDKGQIEIKKTVVSDAADDKTKKEFTFTVSLKDAKGAALTGKYSFTGTTDGTTAYSGEIADGGKIVLKHGGSVIINNLPIGASYTVVETADDGFTTTKTGDTGTVSTTLQTAAFTNTRKTGNLKVSKTVVSDASADKTTKEFTFTVTLSDKTISKTYGDMTFKNGVATFKLKDGESKTATGLPTDITYTVIETAEDGFTTAWTGNQNGTITTAQGETTATNTREKGDLEVTKTVVSDAADDKTKDFTFTVTLGDNTISGTYNGVTFTNGVATFTLKHGDKKEIKDLPTGITYTVTETAEDGFSVTSTGETGTISKTVSTAAFTNTRVKGGIILKKTVTGTTRTDADFTFTVTLGDKTINGTYGDMAFTNGVATVVLKNGESKSATDLPTGITYSVVENTPPAGYAASSLINGSGTVTSNTITVEQTNIYRAQGENTPVGKKILNGEPLKKDQFEFKITYVNGDKETELVRVKNAADGSIAFPVIRYIVNPTAQSTGVSYDKTSNIITITAKTFEDLGQETFRVTEVPGTEERILYSAASYDIVASVAQDATDHSKLNVTLTPAKDIDFVNDEPEKKVFTGGDTTTNIDGQLVSPGQVLTYSISYENNAGKTSDITIEDAIPQYTTYVDGSVSDGGSYADGKVTWSFKEVAAGTKGTVTFQVKVDDAAAGEEITNESKVRVGENDAKTNIVTNPVPEKDVYKKGGTTSINGQLVQAGDELTYKISYKNGHDTKADVTVTDNISELLKYVDFVSADNGGALANGVITWTIADVAAGAEGEVSFTVKVKDTVRGETLENKANVQIGDDPAVDTNPVDNPTPKKEVYSASGTTSIDGQTVGVGDTLKYEITYTNGHKDKADVVIKDDITELLDYVTFGSADNDGKLENGVITWTLKDVAAGTTGTVTFTVTVKTTAAGNTLENEASVQVGTDPEVKTNPVENPVPKKDVHRGTDATVSINQQMVAAGETLTYTIHYRNAHDSAADVHVKDDITELLQYVEFVSASDGGTLKDGVITWTVANVAAGKEGFVSFQVKVKADIKGETLENEAEVAVGDDPFVKTNPVENPVPEKDVHRAGDTKTSINGQLVGVGEELTYTIHYKNSRETAATVSVKDDITKLLQYVDFVSADNGGTLQNDVITWTVANVAAGAEGQVSFTVKVKEAAAGETLENKAQVRAENDPFVDTNPVENPVPEKDVFKSSGTVSIDGQLVAVGDELRYEITYINGHDTVADVTVTDDLTELLKYAEFVKAENNGTLGTDNVITWTVKDVDAGTSGTVSFTVKVKDAAAGETLENTAKVAVGTDPAVNTNPVENPVPEKDVFKSSGTVSIDGQLVAVGDELKYEITYINGHDEKADVTVTDDITELLQYVDFVSADNGGALDKTTNIITWTIKDVAARTSGTVSFTVKVKDAAAGEILKNEAEVQVGNDPKVKTNPVENPVPEKDVFLGSGTTSIDGVMVGKGDVLRYEITYFNGHDTKADVTVTDDISKLLQYADYNSADNDGAFDEKTGVITWTLKDVAAGASGTVSFTVTVKDTVKGETLENQADVKVGTDPQVKTNPVENPTPKKEVFKDSGLKTEIDGRLVGAGDTLTYRISYENGTDKDADITIEDTIPQYTTYVADSASDGGVYNAGTGKITWTLTKVPVGTKGSVTFQVKVDETAGGETIENEATVRTAENESKTNLVTNPVPKKDVFTPGKTTVSIDGEQVSAGEELEYHIEYQNTYDTVATIVITDAIPKYTSYVASSASDDGVYADGVVTWTLENVAAGKSGYVSFKVKVDDDVEGVTIDNTAKVKTGENEANTNTTTNPVPKKDVFEARKLTISIDGEQVSPGQTLVYRIDYQNAKDTAADVEITDAIPVHTTYVTNSASNSGVYDAASRTISWTIKNVAAGTKGYVTFSVTVDDDAEGQLIENQAKVKTGENEAKTNITTNPVPEKDVVTPGVSATSIDGEQVSAGQILEYHIKYQNENETDGTVVITDKIPEYTTYVDKSADQNGVYDEKTKTITWTFTGVKAGKSGEVSFQVKVNDDVNGKVIENTAKVKTGKNEAETNTTTNPVPKKDVFTPGETTISIDDEQVSAGEVLEYHISYQNTNDSAAEVVITDKIPEHTTYVENSADNGGVYDAATRTITWTISPVQAGNKGTVSFQVKVDDDAEGEVIENTAKVKTGNNAADTNTTTNPVPEKDVFKPGEMTISIDNEQVAAGDTLEYKISYKNTHDEAVKVEISDKIPDHTTYVAGSATDGGLYADAERTLTWTIENVPANSEGYVTFQVKVDKDANSEVLENTAKVKTGNNTATTNTTKNPVPKKDVFEAGKTTVSIDHEQVETGTTLEYQIKYQNTYDTTVDVVITDAIPDHTTYVDGSASNGGKYDAETRTITWTIKNAAAGKSGTVSFKVTVDDDANGEVIENTAKVKTGNNEAKTNITKNPVPEKDVFEAGKTTVSIDNEQVETGTTLEYQISYQNTYDTAVDVEITDTIPDHTTYVDGSASNGGKYDAATRTITWTIKNAAAGSEGTVSFQVTVDDDASGKVLDNQAKVKTGNNTAKTNMTKNPVPKKDVFEAGKTTVSIDNEQVETGTTLEYQISYQNTHDTAVDVEITDAIPEHTTYVDDSASDDGEYADGVITWKIENVKAGASGYVTFKVTVDDDASGEVLENQATVKTGKNTAKTNMTENPVPKKDVFKSADTQTSIDGNLVETGEELLYTIYYENRNENDGTVVITDVIPEHTTYVGGSASNDGVYANGTITWTIKDVKPGTKGTVTFKVTVDADASGKTIENTAKVRTGKNTVDTNTTTNPVPKKEVFREPEMTTEIDGKIVGVGDVLTYKISYKNGTDKTADVIVADKIPDYTTYVDGSASDDGKFENGQITWTIKDVKPGTEGSVTFQVTVDEEAGGETVKNKATVRIGDNSATTNLVTNPVPEKDVFKQGETTTSIDNEPVTAGQKLTYKIEYTNTDGEDVTLTVADQIPNYTNYIDGTAKPTATFNASTGARGELTWQDVTVKAGETFTATFDVQVDTDAGMVTILNTAEFRDGENTFKTNTTKNPTSKKDVFAENDTTFQTSIDGEQVEVGQVLTYKVDYKNIEKDPITVTISDKIPEYTEYVDGSASDGGKLVNGAMEWTISDVQPDTEGYVTFQVKVLESARGERIDNTAKVKYGNSEVETTTTKNPVPKKDVFENATSVISIDGEQVSAGQVLTYRVYYENANAKTSTVEITDNIPEYTTYVNGSASNGGAYDATENKITWIIDNVAAGTKGSVTFQVKVNEDAAGVTVENQATVKTGKNEAKTNTTENPVPKKEIFKDSGMKTEIDGKIVGVGDELIYKITYRNETGKTADVNIEDAIPQYTTYVSGSASDGGVYKNGKITWTIADVKDGTEGYVTFKVTVDKIAAGEDIKNEAKVRTGKNTAKTNTVTNPVPKKDVFEENDNTISIDGEQAEIGKVLVYQIWYQNTEDKAADVVITDAIPEYTTYVDGSASNDGVYANGVITWTIKDVPAGTKDSVTFHVTVDDDAAGEAIENQATVKVGNNEAKTNITTNPVPKKDVYQTNETTISIDGEQVEAGQELFYRISYQNTNEKTSTVVITDAIPAHTAYVEDSASDGGVYANGKITWTITDVEAGESGDVTFKVKVDEDAGGEVIENTANVKTGNNESKTNTTENPVPEKDVFADATSTTSIDGEQVAEGQELNYRISYENRNDTAGTVVITDVIPEHTTYVTGSATNGGKYDAATGTITWTIQNVKAGDKGTVSFTVTVDKDAGGEKITNQATVKTGKNEAKTNVTTNPVPKKDVYTPGKETVSIDGEQVEAGQELLYKVFYQNTYDEAVTVEVKDAIPEHTEYVIDSVSKPGTYDAKNRTLSWTITDVAAGTSGYVSFKVKVDEDAGGEVIKNTASVKTGNNEAETNTTTNPVPKKDVVEDATSTTSIDGEQVTTGQVLTYRIEYQNTNEETSTVEIEDMIPKYTTYVDGSASDDGIYADGVITWKIENVKAGASGYVTFRVEVDADASGKVIKNEATVKTGENAAKTNLTQNPVPEKEIFKDSGMKTEIDGKIVGVGDELIYKITYRNETGKTADVNIEDVIPQYTTYVSGSASDGGVYKNGKITWTIADVKDGTEGYVTFKVTVDKTAAGEEIKNEATVRTGKNDAKTNLTTNPVPKKDVFLPADEQTSIDGEQVEAGQELLYKIHYQNTEDKDATIVIEDAIPEYTTYVDGSADNGGEYAGGVITWTLENVKAGAEGDVTFKVTVNANAGGEVIENQATVRNGQNEAKTNITTNPVPKKDVFTPGKTEISIDGEQVTEGQILLYKISYQNTNEKTATVEITDAIPEHTTYINGSADNGGSYDAGTKTLTWTIDNVPAGTAGEVTFKVAVDEDASGKKIENTATVKTGNNTAKTNTVTNPVPEKDVVTPGQTETSIDGEQVQAGQELMYVIRYQNTNQTTAKVEITDAIPVHTTYKDGSADPDGTYDAATRTISWTIDGVKAGESGEVTFIVTVDADAAGEVIENEANVKTGKNTVKTNMTTNPVPKKDVVTPGKTSISMDGEQVQAGQELMYIIRYQNTNKETAKVEITDRIPEYTTYVDDSASDGGTYADGVITWTIEDVPAGESGEVTFTVTVDADTEGEAIENTATVKTGNNEAKTNTVTNPVPKKDVVRPGKTDISIDGELVGVGETLMYKISYQNAGTEAATVEIMDEIPQYTEYVSGSASDGGAYSTSARMITWKIENVPAGQKGEVTFKVIVTDDGAGKIVENTATVKTGNNAAKTNMTTNPVPKKDVTNGTSSIDGQTVAVGDTLRYEITFVNTKGDGANATVTDTLAEALTYAGYSVKGGEAGSFSQSGQKISLTVENIADGATVTVVFLATVNSAAETIENTAYVDGTKTNTVVNGTPVKDVKRGTTSIDGKSVEVGETVTYTVTFVNHKGDGATANVTDTLPAQLTYSANSWSVSVNGKDVNASFTQSGQILAWSLRNLPANATVEITFRATVNEAAAAIDNTAVVDQSKTNTTTNPAVNPPDTPHTNIYNPPTTTIEENPVPRGLGDLIRNIGDDIE